MITNDIGRNWGEILEIARNIDGLIAMLIYSCIYHE